MLTTQTSGSIAIQPGGVLHFINHGCQRLSFDAISLCAGDDIWLTFEGADGAGSLTLEPLELPQPLWDAVAARFSARAAKRRDYLIYRRRRV